MLVCISVLSLFLILDSSQAPNSDYNVENFKYDKENDFYVCPEGKLLTTTGKLHETTKSNFKRYPTKECLTCFVKSECSKAKYGKAIQRSQYQDLIDNNKTQIENNENYYKQRQAIVEHPYGTIKRQCGFNYIMTKKTKQRVEADVGLIFTAYNLRRLMSIIGTERLIEYLQHFILFIFSIKQNSAEWFILNIFPTNMAKSVLFRQSDGVANAKKKETNN